MNPNAEPPPGADRRRPALAPSFLSIVVECLVLGIALYLAYMMLNHSGEAIHGAIRKGAGRYLEKTATPEAVPELSPSYTSYSIGALVGAGILALICTIHAIRIRSPYIAVVIGAAAYGLFIEYFDISVFHSYYYGRSPFMIFGKVPLTIVLCWGSIAYSAMRTSDYLELKWYLKPIYDGMLALSIDLALDPVAVSLPKPLWIWVDNPEFGNPATFLAIPLANFYAWFVVVFSYSLTIRAGFRIWPERWRGGWTAAIVSVLACPVAFLLFSALLFLYFLGFKILGLPESLIVSIWLGAVFLLVIIYLPAANHDDDPDLISFASPILLHGYAMFAYYDGGLYKAMDNTGVTKETEGFIIFLPTIAAFSLITFAWPFLDKLRWTFGAVKRATEAPDGRLHSIESPRPKAPPTGPAGRDSPGPPSS